MAKLSAAQRRKLPAKDFALGKGKEPINDRSHAEAALTMGMRNKSPEQKARIRAAVHRKYPDLGKSRKTTSSRKPSSGKR
jgi:hypothetical protein